MGYLCATCGGIGGLFETSHAHSDKDSCISELRTTNANLTQKLDSATKCNCPGPCNAQGCLLKEVGRLRGLRDVYSKEAFDLQAKLRCADLQAEEAKRIFMDALERTCTGVDQVCDQWHRDAKAFIDGKVIEKQNFMEQKLEAANIQVRELERALSRIWKNAAHHGGCGGEAGCVDSCPVRIATEVLAEKQNDECHV